MSKYKFENLDYVNRVIKKWKTKPHDDQRRFCQQLRQKIQYMDNNKLCKELSDYNRRNEMVRIMWGLQKNLPFLFTPGQKVIVRWKKRPLHAVVVSLGKPEYREVTVRPIDNVYKEPIQISEWLLESDEGRLLRDEQLSLF